MHKRVFIYYPLHQKLFCLLECLTLRWYESLELKLELQCPCEYDSFNSIFAGDNIPLLEGKFSSFRGFVFPVWYTFCSFQSSSSPS